MATDLNPAMNSASTWSKNVAFEIRRTFQTQEFTGNKSAICHKTKSPIADTTLNDIYELNLSNFLPGKILPTTELSGFHSLGKVQPIFCFGIPMSVTAIPGWRGIESVRLQSFVFGTAAWILSRAPTRRTFSADPTRWSTSSWFSVCSSGRAGSRMPSHVYVRKRQTYQWDSILNLLKNVRIKITHVFLHQKLRQNWHICFAQEARMQLTQRTNLIPLQIPGTVGAFCSTVKKHHLQKAVQILSRRNML